MKRTLVRWWSIFSATSLVALFLMIAGGASFVLNNDPTYISWIIIAVFVTGSIHAGMTAKSLDKSPLMRKMTLEDSKNTSDFFIDTCGSLGLLGTIVGLMISMMGSLGEIDASNVDSIKSALTSISSGVGSALLTTTMGVVSMLSLRMQWASNKIDLSK